MNRKLNLVLCRPRNVVPTAVQVSERTHSPLALLAAQIVLRNQTQKKMHARLRPEIEFILQTELPRERNNQCAAPHQIEG